MCKMKEKGYVTMERVLAQDKNLSFGALGLLCELLALPPEWDIRKKSFERANCGRDKINNLFAELEKSGHLRKETVRDDSGKFNKTKWVINHDKNLSMNGNTVDGKPVTGNPQLYNNKYIYIYNQKEKRNTKEKRKSLSDEEFTGYRALYPARSGSINAAGGRRKLNELLASGKYTEVQLKDCILAYQKYCDKSGITGTAFVMQMSKFFGRDEHFLENWKNFKEVKDARTPRVDARSRLQEIERSKGRCVHSQGVAKNL